MPTWKTFLVCSLKPTGACVLVGRHCTHLGLSSDAISVDASRAFLMPSKPALQPKTCSITHWTALKKF